MPCCAVLRCAVWCGVASMCRCCSRLSASIRSLDASEFASLTRPSLPLCCVCAAAGTLSALTEKAKEGGSVVFCLSLNAALAATFLFIRVGAGLMEVGGGGGGHRLLLLAVMRFPSQGS